MAFSSELGLARLGALELGFIAGQAPTPPVVVAGGSSGSWSSRINVPQRDARKQRLLHDDDDLLIILSTYLGA